MKRHPILALIVAYSLFTQSVLAGKGASKCNTTRHDEADTCMQKMFLIGDRTQRFRETLGQMQNYCKQILELQGCVNRFSRECLPELGRQVTNLLLYGVKRVNRQYCNSEKGMLRFNEIAKCGNHQLEQKHQCMDTFLTQLRLVEKRTDEEMIDTRIHYVCCYFSTFKSCILDTFEMGDSRKRCPDEDVKQGLIDLISGYADEPLDMVCGEFGNDSPKCDQLLSPGKTKTDGNEKVKEKSKDGKRLGKSRSKGTQKNAKSILPYFVGIFGNL